MSEGGLGQLPKLGKSAVSVGRLGFGGVPLGNLYRTIGEREALDTVTVAIDLGLRYFDTAPLYGYGLSERRLGLYLRQLARDEFVISTKVGRTLKPTISPQRDTIFTDAADFVETFDFTYDGVMRQFEDSLQRLGLARVDALVIHDLGLWHMKEQAVLEGHFRDLETGGLKALLELRQEGRIGAIGAGANELTLCDRFVSLGEIDFILLALRYTLLDQSAARGFLDRAGQNQVSIVVGAPFQSGILATGTGPGSHFNYGGVPPNVVRTVERLEAICLSNSVPLKAAALQFPLQNPAVVSVLAGMGSPEEVRENVSMSNLPIPAELWSDLRTAGLIES